MKTARRSRKAAQMGGFFTLSRKRLAFILEEMARTVFDITTDHYEYDDVNGWHDLSADQIEYQDVDIL